MKEEPIKKSEILAVYEKIGKKIGLERKTSIVRGEKAMKALIISGMVEKGTIAFINDDMKTSKMIAYKLSSNLIKKMQVLTKEWYKWGKFTDL